MVLRFESFQAPPKRKYVRKAKSAQINIIDSLDQQIQKQEEDQLNLDMKRLKINDEKKVSFAPLPSPLVIPSTIKVQPIATYEFMKPLHIYLYLIVTQISKSVQKYVYFTNLYNPMGHITLPTFQPFAPIGVKEYEEKMVTLSGNVTLHIRTYHQEKSDLTWEKCQENLGAKKRKVEDEKSDWDYDFCQLKCKLNEQDVLKDINKYVFLYENQYFSVDYQLKIHFPTQDAKLLLDELH